MIILDYIVVLSHSVINYDGKLYTHNITAQSTIVLDIISPVCTIIVQQEWETTTTCAFKEGATHPKGDH